MSGETSNDSIADLCCVMTAVYSCRQVNRATQNLVACHRLNNFKFSSKTSKKSSKRPLVCCACTTCRHRHRSNQQSSSSKMSTGCKKVFQANANKSKKSNHASLSEPAGHQEGDDDNCFVLAADTSSGGSSCRFKSILASHSVPILFVIFCFLIIANSRCDHVGGTNVGETAIGYNNNNNNNDISGDLGLVEPMKQEISTGDESYRHQQEAATAAAANSKVKPDPLSFLREIYLDSGNKVITFLAPQSDSVQKFHPNGRYGRRSLDNLIEPHAELGHLIYDNDDGQLVKASRAFADSNKYVGRPGDSSTLNRILHKIRSGGNLIAAASAPAPAATLGGHYSVPASDDTGLVTVQSSKYSGQRQSNGATGAAAAATQSANNTGNKRGPGNNLSDAFRSNEAQVASLEWEMNKLLKCNYSGIPGLYWCESSSPADAISRT